MGFGTAKAVIASKGCDGACIHAAGFLHGSWRLERNQGRSLFLFCPEGLTVKEQLERLVLQMYRSGTPYSEAVREFQRAFITAVLRNLNGNQVRAAGKLGMHRNTLRRTLYELDVDIKAVRVSRRRPPVSARPYAMREKKVGATCSVEEDTPWKRGFDERRNEQDRVR